MFDVSDALTIENYTWFGFGGGGIYGFNVDTWATFGVTEMLSLSAGVYVSHYGSPSYYELYAGAEYEIGDVTPYLDLWWSPSEGTWGGDVGLDFERQLGTGPFSLLANTEFDFGASGPDLYVGIGIKFTRGDVDD